MTSDRAAPIREPGIDGNAFLDHLAEAIRLPTVSYEDGDRIDPGDILAIHAFLRDTYPLAHGRCHVETVADLSLLYTWQGTDTGADPIVLMAHLDVVPVEPGTEDEWDQDPFGGTSVDGELWGRGSLDDKGPLIAVMEAVEHLLDNGFVPTRTVIIAYGHDEEIGGIQGAKRTAALLRERGIHPWFVVDEGGWVVDELPPLTNEPVALVSTAEKGYLDLQITAVGDGGHSSIPPRSTAIGKLASAIERLEANPLPAHIEVLKPQFAALAPRLDRRLRLLLTNLRLFGPLVARVLTRRPQTAAFVRTTTAVTMVSGGIKANVLPQEASAVVNFRILPGDSIESVMAHVDRLVGPDLSAAPFGEMRAEPSRFSSTESAAWAVLTRSIEETYPEAIVAPWVMSGATDSRHFRDFAGDVYGFNGFSGTLESISRIHGTGERIRASDAESAVSFFCRLIRNAQG
ncbi:MAG: M20 family peptidase [Acidimicrobiia bacterium]|nr:MAG: M20 family peptidase [Acidimicrobiia bacterium]